MALLGGRDEAARTGMSGPDFRKQSGRTSDNLLVGIAGQVRPWLDTFFQAVFLLSWQEPFQWQAWRHQLDYHYLLGMRGGWRSQRNGEQDGASS